MVEAWNLWNQGIRSSVDIAEVMGIGRQVVLRYLKQGQTAEKCSYSPEEARKNKKKLWKKVVQLDLKGNLIQTWDSMAEPARNYGDGSDTSRSIVRCCKGGTYTAYGFIWLYEEDYNSPSRDTLVDKKVKGRRKAVIQLTLDDVFIKEWDSINEAQRGIIAVNVNISACCRNKANTAGGFKWMYKEDYDKMIFGD